MAEAFTDFKANLRSSYTNRGTDYLAEFYPGLTYDPKKKLDADKIEAELGLEPDDGTPVTIEGMPIGLFENELTVQLWQPVTIRGYTFNVGDNVTLDQTKVKKTPATAATSPGSTRPTRPSGPGPSSRPSGTGCRRRCSARGTRSRRPG